MGWNWDRIGTEWDEMGRIRTEWDGIGTEIYKKDCLNNVGVIFVCQSS